MKIEERSIEDLLLGLPEDEREEVLRRFGELNRKVSQLKRANTSLGSNLAWRVKTLTERRKWLTENNSVESTL